MPSMSAHSAFRRTMALMAAGNPLATVLDALVLTIEAEAPGILCSILLLDPTGKRITLGAGPSLPADYNAAIEGVEIGPNVGSCGTAAYFNKTVIVEDIETDPLWADFKHLAAEASLRACWSHPIRGPGDLVLGTFAIYHRQVSAPTTDDIAFIEGAAELAAIAITRRRMETELASSEARARRALQIERETARDLTTFFDVSLDMLCIRDRNLRFVKVNRAWESVLGYSVEELEGASMLPLVHPDDVGATQGHMEKIQAVDQVSGFVNRYRHRDGSYRHLEWRAQRVGDLVFGVARDVTERLAFEAEMNAAKQAAEAANDAKSDFLANMSHEIRTPLNGVIGVIDALGRTELAPAQREMVGLVESSARTLERLVSDILDVSKIEAGRLEIEHRVFDLGKECESLVELHQVRAQEKSLSFHAEFGPKARGEFHGDSTRIKQILQPPFQRHQVHRSRRGRAADRRDRVGGRIGRPRRGGVRDPRHRHGVRRGLQRDAVPALQPGGHHHHPPVRRHRPGPGHLQGAGGNDGRRNRGGIRAGPGQRVPRPAAVAAGACARSL